ncbi:MAG: Bax inhibitor-1/YccA family protein [Candidatus Magnetominusculus sp. LBB02]|nr:Bax inhibitor-1/YccA family protein [Candidatus Magnetominusculus sp. LBB02]
MMRTSNPALRVKRPAAVYAAQGTMTVQGAVNKTAFLLLILLGSASWVWRTFFEEGLQAITPFIGIGLAGGLIAALVTIFVSRWSPVTAPIYAVFEGLLLGGITAVYEQKFHGLAFQAVALTFGTLFMLLFAYKAGIVRASDKFKAGIIAATGGIFIVYLASFLLRLFGVQMPFIYGSGAISIVFSAVVVVIAALNLVLDFDFIDNAAREGAPKYYEWYGGFAIMVTLVWLYIEILNLLAKLRDR